MATVGGALTHADPNQDPPVTLLALDAPGTADLAAWPARRGPERFFTDYYETVLQPDELLTEIHVPIPSAPYWQRLSEIFATHRGRLCHRKRRCQRPPQPLDRRLRGLPHRHGLRWRDPHARAQPSSRARPAADRRAAARGWRLAQAITDPLSDTRGSASYKRAMAGVFVRRALAQAWEQALAAA